MMSPKNHIRTYNSVKWVAVDTPLHSAVVALIESMVGYGNLQRGQKSNTSV